MSEMLDDGALADARPRPLVSDLVTAIALRDPRLVTSIVLSMRRALLDSDETPARATVSELLRQIERDSHTGAFIRARTSLIRHSALFSGVF